MPEELGDCFAAWGRLGRDANGSILAAEREAVLERDCGLDAGRREAWEHWWSELEDERTVFHDELEELAGE